MSGSSRATNSLTVCAQTNLLITLLASCERNDSTRANRACWCDPAKTRIKASSRLAASQPGARRNKAAMGLHLGFFLELPCKGFLDVAGLGPALIPLRFDLGRSLLGLSNIFRRQQEVCLQ